MIGDPLPYADGAESELLAIIEAAVDRRVGSDELAGAVRDWPTAYHLAAEREVLMAPVVMGSDDRVLDVGAGSGVNTRICADRGAVVTAVEGSEDRARLIAHRCAGLDGVEILCGSLYHLGDDRRGEFDVVLAVGVLEYAGSAQGGGQGPDALLRQLADALAPGGVVVLAIENRLGLKYLLGFPEDHLGLPWAGLEDRRPGEPTTWSRRELARMLDRVGLTAQKWLYPFPDYKLPTAVLAEEAYNQPEASDMVDQIVGHPTSSQHSRPVLVTDDRAAHRALLAAGLGRDVANSFLVVAGRDPQAVADRVDGQALAWRVAPDRRRRWRQEAVVVGSDEGPIVRRRVTAGDRAGDFEDWLGQVEVPEEPFYAGRDLEQCVLDCARGGDVDGVAELLREWRAVLAAHEAPRDEGAELHPYLPSDTVRILPPDWLDAGPDNFVVTAEGLKFVDREWHAAGGVDVRLVVVRGLWKTVSALLSARCHLPWPVTWTNDRLMAHLGHLIGEDIDSELLDRWRAAEADLVGRVYLQPSARLAELRFAGIRSRMDQLRSPMAPYRRIEHEVHRLRELVAELAEPHDLVAAHDQARARLIQAEVELSASQAHLAHAEEERDSLRAELAEARSRLVRVAWRERVHNAIARLIRRLPPSGRRAIR